MSQIVCKTLSRNDLGYTGGHQAGILVPKEIIKLDFFPFLDPSEYNPRCDISFNFEDRIIAFTFIYYNNRLHGNGTRNEYRITGMTKFFRENCCEPGDVLKFSKDMNGYKINIEKQIITVEGYREALDRPIVIRAGWYCE